MPKSTIPTNGESITVSNYTAWAARLPLKNKNQKDLIQWMAERVDADGTAYAPPLADLQATTDIGTKKQLELALRGLMEAGHLTSRYDMAKYKHIYTLHAH